MSNTKSYLKITGAVIAGLLALTGLWDWTTRFLEGDLEATALYGPFAVPPPVDSLIIGLNDVNDLTAIDSVVSEAWSALETPIDSRMAERVAGRVRMHYGQVITDRVPYNLADLNGYWHFTIRNESRRAVTSARLSVPHARYAKMTRQSGDSVTFFGNYLELGALQPREELVVVAWTWGVPLASDARNVALTHDAGVGNVALRRPVGTAGQIVDRYGGAVIVAALFLTIYVLVMVVSYRSGASSVSQDDSPNAGNAAT